TRNLTLTRGPLCPFELPGFASSCARPSGLPSARAVLHPATPINLSPNLSFLSVLSIVSLGLHYSRPIAIVIGVPIGPPGATMADAKITATTGTGAPAKADAKPDAKPDLKKERIRSPSYPAFPLSEAVERARQF